ncbi:6335_t:CDS:1, partial [Scutellospora calospora]
LTKSVKDTETKTSQIEKTLKNSSLAIEDLNLENSVLEKENIDILLAVIFDNSNKENITTNNMQAKFTIEIEDPNLSKTLI